ncbi:MAG TPA: protein kinase [Candidatus Eisenbacteria bacterium]|nr:protein kinase [Candidatus Eisenbacteria bacterium]
MIGRTLARYRIEEQLGQGGMGVVYRAHDPHLERDVALKVLPEGTVDADSRARFRLEALALSRLSHPGIGTAFDFDHQDGVDFLVMEFVPGTTLAARLATSALEEAEVLDIGLQIAEALDAAHEQGIVHRDLKPANVMVTPRGRAKVLDFGLAKLRAERAPALTGPQTMLGTLGYMAPEQLLGTEVDARADMFAFGALLYEMALGRPPFGHPGSVSVVAEVLNRPVTPLRQKRPLLSRELEALTLRCLEKDPARRPSAREAAQEIRRIRARDEAPSAPLRSRIESIAVLPLENLSRDADQEYFADGMTEALISDLSKIRALRVISRTSAMRFKGVRQPLPDIARELGVDAIVEGSVLRAGNRVRITAQLIEAATDRHLWAERYERDVADVLGIQSEVAQAIAGEIQVQLSHQERSHFGQARRVNPQAHEDYLKGRHLWNQRTVSALERALELFERAIARDPSYAPAFSGLADCHNLLADNNTYPPEVALPRAKAAALKAIELDPNLAEAHTSLAATRFEGDWDYSGAEQEYRLAIDLDRGYATAHQWYANLLTALGRMDEAVEHALEAVRRDPLSFILYSNAGDALYYARRYDEALEIYHRGIELAPEFGQTRMDLARTLELQGRYDDAIKSYLRGIDLMRRDPARSSGLACVYAASGREDEARRILAALKDWAQSSFVPPYAIASVHARLGEHDAALSELERGFEVRDRAMVYLNVNPRFDALRGEPRFGELVRRMRLAP